MRKDIVRRSERAKKTLSFLTGESRSTHRWQIKGPELKTCCIESSSETDSLQNSTADTCLDSLRARTKTKRNETKRFGSKALSET